MGSNPASRTRRVSPSVITIGGLSFISGRFRRFFNEMKKFKMEAEIHICKEKMQMKMQMKLGG